MCSISVCHFFFFYRWSVVALIDKMWFCAYSCLCVDYSVDLCFSKSYWSSIFKTCRKLFDNHLKSYHVAVLKLHTSWSHLPSQPVQYSFNQFPTKGTETKSRSWSTELRFPWTGSVLGDRLNLTDRFWFLTSCSQGSASPWHPQFPLIIQISRVVTLCFVSVYFSKTHTHTQKKSPLEQLQFSACKDNITSVSESWSGRAIVSEMRWNVKGIQVQKCLPLISNSLSGTNTDTPVQKQRACQAQAARSPKTCDEFTAGPPDKSEDGKIAQCQSSPRSIFKLWQGALRE